MTRYKSRPREIEAEQFDLNGAWPMGVCDCTNGGPLGAHVHTAHDGQRVGLIGGEFIVPEPDGRGYYPIQPDIFEESYEKVDQPAQESES